MSEAIQKPPGARLDALRVKGRLVSPDATSEPVAALPATSRKRPARRWVPIRMRAVPKPVENREIPDVQFDFRD